MSEQSSFFPTPADNLTPQGEAPAALFDLAVNRAATALRGLGLTPNSAQGKAELGRWHARTRFARRIDLSQVQRALGSKPPGGEYFWTGGVTGGWQPGKAPFP